MTDRIRSQHGNVIGADFRPRATFDVTMKIETLFQDASVCLIRCSTWMGEKPFGPTLHLLADIATGKVIST